MTPVHEQELHHYDAARIYAYCLNGCGWAGRLRLTEEAAQADLDAHLPICGGRS